MPELVGIWRLMEERATDGTGRRVASRFGPEGQGLLQVGPRRMMAVLVDSRDELPDGEPRQYNSYCGAWRLEGGTLVTRVDAGLPGLPGTVQVRQVRWEGERLVLSPPPMQRGGQTVMRELVWEKIG